MVYHHLNLKKSNKEVLITTIAISSIIDQFKLKNINPTIKYGGSLILGILLNNKRNYKKDIGTGLVLFSTLNLVFDNFKIKKCSFNYSKNAHLKNRILIHANSGKIIDKSNSVIQEIYLTNSKNKNGWNNSFKLLHCLNISGNNGGLMSKKGQVVIWNNLQDHTLEFNQLLVKWILHFEKHKVYFENNYFDKLIYWYSMVNDNKPLDIKNNKWHPSIKGEWSKYNNTLMRYDDYGNILYGAAGAAFGLEENTLLLGGNINQIFKSGFDDSKDVFSIKIGIALYLKYKLKK